MTFSSEQIKSVVEIVNKHTNSYLDNFTVENICDVIKEEMKKADASAISIADAAFDYAYNNNLGNITMSIACKQMISKDILLIMRNDIINYLND